MYLNIVFLPFIGSVLCGGFGRFLGPYGAGIITTMCVIFSLGISIFAFFEISFFGSPCYIKLAT